MTAPSATLLERVRKLLAQAEDSAATAAEAEAFNARAAELIARHEIDAAHLASTGRTRNEIGYRVIPVDQPYARDKAQLLTSVADPLRCQTVHTHGRDRFCTSRGTRPAGSAFTTSATPTRRGSWMTGCR